MNNKHPAGTDCSYEYTVRRGDSFYLIAHRLGVPLRDLLEANSSINPARLMVGDVLCIPTAGQDHAAKPNAQGGQAASDSTAQTSPAPASSESNAAKPDAADQPAPGSAAPEPAACPVPAPQGNAAEDTPEDADEPEDLLDRPAADLRADSGQETTATAAASNPEAGPAPRSIPQPTSEPAEAPAPEAVPMPLPAPEENATTISAPVSETAAADAACNAATARTIGPGETLADIQLASGLNLHTLAAANPGTDLDALVPGQVLCVPAENIPCPIIPTYTLRRDDTLESAALRLNLSIGALLRANPCLAPADFRPGAVICLPEA